MATVREGTAIAVGENATLRRPVAPKALGAPSGYVAFVDGSEGLALRAVFVAVDGPSARTDALAASGRHRVGGRRAIDATVDVLAMVVRYALPTVRICSVAIAL